MNLFIYFTVGASPFYEIMLARVLLDHDSKGNINMIHNNYYNYVTQFGTAQNNPAFICSCIFISMLSLSTVVFSSRIQENLWLPKIMHPEQTTLKQYYHKKLSILQG